jgi:MFS family permease
VGGVLGGLAVAHLGRRLPPVPILGLCTIAFGLMDMALFSYPLRWHGVALGLAIIVLVGFPGAATGATWNALMQSGIEDARRGRVYGLVGALSSLSLLLGTIAAGTLGGILGPIFLLNATQGVGYLIAGAMVLVVLRHAWLRPRAEVAPEPVA